MYELEIEKPLAHTCCKVRFGKIVENVRLWTRNRENLEKYDPEIDRSTDRAIDRCVDRSIHLHAFEALS